LEQLEMKSLFTSRLSQLAIAAFAAFTLLAAMPVEAKRLGGGAGSKVGRPTNNAALQKPTTPALMSSMGLGGAMAGMLSNLIMFGGLALLALFVYRKFFAPKQVLPQGASAYQAQPAAQIQPPAQFQAPAAASGGASVNHPAVSDVTGFTTNAKTQYLALQAAWDAGDIGKIRNMTTDTLFMELAQQIANRKGAPNHTEVMNLHCELLDVRDEASDTVATLRFTGTAREDGADTAGFEDIWSLTKPSNAAGGWLLAGVESN
jgi:predicted lipid-binding transport protein (Tim44 family)